MSNHIVSVKTNLVVFVLLLLLLLATVGAAFLPLADWHLPVALGFATIKAILIGLFFMHVYYRHKLTWIVSLASLLWLGILIVLTLSDYLARDWLPNIKGK
jgi:cytochrome c oxidase subunit IV